MRRPRVGLVLHAGGVTGVAISGHTRIETWRLEADDTLPARLAAELESRHGSMRRLRVGLDRTLVIVKEIELPSAAARDLSRMVGFELERHLPFACDESRVDWVPVPASVEGAFPVLIVACEARVVTGALRLLEAIHRVPRSLTVASHNLPALLPRRLRARRAVWIHGQAGRVELLWLEDGRVRLSRSVPRQEAAGLTTEIRRTLPLVRWPACEAVWVSGEDADVMASAPPLADLGAPVAPPPYRPAVAKLVAQLPPEQQGPVLLALATAVRGPSPTLDLLPRELRPRTPTRAQRVTAGLATLVAVLGATALLTHGYVQDRYLRRVSDEMARVEPEAKAVERLLAQVADQKRLLATLRSLEEGGLRPLDVLHELTELVPSEAWLQSASMDRQGVELTGQAAAASQLIPLFEQSKALERAELTAPVTKAQGKEQFRLRAAWKGSARTAPR